jgi:hypothetical protein
MHWHSPNNCEEVLLACLLSPGHGTGVSSADCVEQPMREGILCLTPIWQPWQSSQLASGLRMTATIAVSQGYGGGIRFPAQNRAAENDNKCRETDGPTHRERTPGRRSRRCSDGWANLNRAGRELARSGPFPDSPPLPAERPTGRPVTPVPQRTVLASKTPVPSGVRVFTTPRCRSVTIVRVRTSMPSCSNWTRAFSDHADG